MLLRASSEQEGLNYDLNAVTSLSRDPGVPHGEMLRRLAEAAIQGDWLGLAELRPHAEQVMGAQQVVDALTVAAAFNGITRVADATGIPLDDNTAQTTQDMRADTGITQFSYQAKSARYD